MKKLGDGFYQAESENKGIEFCNKQKSRARLVTGTYSGAIFHYVHIGSGGIGLSGNERLSYDNKNIKCPECLESTTKDELDMFGGMCESCIEI